MGPKEKCWKIAKTIHWFLIFFPLVPSWKLRKKKLSKRAEILWSFRNFKIQHLLKISAVYHKNCRMPPFLWGKYFKLGIPFALKTFPNLLNCYCKFNEFQYRISSFDEILFTPRSYEIGVFLLGWADKDLSFFYQSSGDYRSVNVDF